MLPSKNPAPAASPPAEDQPVVEARKRKDRPAQDRRDRAGCLIRLLPLWIVVCGLAVLVIPNLGNLAEHFATLGQYGGDRRLAESTPQSQGSGTIAGFFTAEVAYWHDDILRWAAESDLDPDLVATIIQIESCGDPRAVSPAGAQGLMQVMPQHFSAGEDSLAPDTNASRGLSILRECLYSPYNPQHDVGMAFACYNGGPSVFVYVWDAWPEESRYYYIWGTGIYQDAQNELATSDTLQQWLAAGGQSLCRNARLSLGLDGG
jgi:soluble lytic murein transglycosylase-like protein